MKFQDSKPEIRVPESKVYILPSKMYTFWNFDEISIFHPNLKLESQSQKHTFCLEKCILFGILG